MPSAAQVRQCDVAVTHSGLMSFSSRPGSWRVRMQCYRDRLLLACWQPANCERCDGVKEDLWGWWRGSEIREIWGCGHIARDRHDRKHQRDSGSLTAPCPFLTSKHRGRRCSCAQTAGGQGPGRVAYGQRSPGHDAQGSSSVPPVWSTQPCLYWHLVADGEDDGPSLRLGERDAQKQISANLCGLTRTDEE